MKVFLISRRKEWTAISGYYHQSISFRAYLVHEKYFLVPLQTSHLFTEASARNRPTCQYHVKKRKPPQRLLFISPCTSSISIASWQGEHKSDATAAASPQLGYAKNQQEPGAGHSACLLPCCGAGDRPPTASCGNSSSMYVAGLIGLLLQLPPFVRPHILASRPVRLFLWT